MIGSYTVTEKRVMTAAAARRWWALWLLSIATFLLVTLPNLALWPTLFQDEIQIIDLGRVFLDPQTDWSMGWLVNDSMPSRPLAFIGAVLQEGAYRLFAPSYVGARISGVAGAVLACWVVFGWLHSRGTPPLPALLLCFAFLLDPIFNESYRQGRVDSWAFFVCIAACWVLRVAAGRRSSGQDESAPIILAGLLTGASVFVWPSSVALFPMILVELAHTLGLADRGHGRFRKGNWLTAMGFFALGGIIAVGVCLVPFFVHLEASLTSLEQGARVQQAAAVIQRSIIGMYVIYNPWLLPALLLAVLLRREWALLAALAAALAMMLQTMVYPMRILYLLPYIVAIVAGATTTVMALEQAPRRKLLMLAALAFMLGGNLWVSAVERPLIASRQAAARAPDQFDEPLAAAIGAGPYRVVTTEWEVYFAARAMGWKLYYPFGATRKTGEDYLAFLRSMDYAITRDSFVFSKPVKPEELEQAGFVRQAPLAIGPAGKPADASGRIRKRPPAAERLYEDLVIYRNTAVAPPGSTSD